MEQLDNILDTITFYLDEIADKAEVLDKAEKDSVMYCIQKLMDIIDSEEVNYSDLCDATRKLVTQGGYLGTRDWLMMNHIMTVSKLVATLETYVTEEENEEGVDVDYESGE